MSKKHERPLGWTTIKESRKLIEAGLKPESADMHYTLAEDESFYILYTDNEVAYGSDRIVPCWSLGALLNLLPFPVLWQEMTGGTLFWRCGVTFMEDDTTYISPMVIDEMEAVVDCVRWVIEKGAKNG